MVSVTLALVIGAEAGGLWFGLFEL